MTTTRITLFHSHAPWLPAKSIAASSSVVAASGRRWLANKVNGVRAGLCHDHFSARQGVEDDDMNVLCVGGRVMGVEVAWDHAQAFISATFSGAERHRRRLLKVAQLEG